MDIYILFGFLFIALGVIFFLFMKRNPSAPDRAAEQSFLMLQGQLQELIRAHAEASKTADQKLEMKLESMQRSMQGQLGTSAQIVKDVTEKIEKLNATNQQIVGVKDQLQSLQDILKNPKQRGILGEYLLETVLKNIFPPGTYEMQYPFKNGDTVDAVIFYNIADERRVIPIDSKFSLENYNRMIGASGPEERAVFEKAFRADLKNRIDETAKYVRPEEGTTDFAFMFIPAEAIYYDLLINKVGTTSAQDLVEYATKEKKVMIVSPTSFLAYLQTLLHGMKREHFYKETEAIRKRVDDLGRHIKAYEDYFKKVGGHLGTTVNAYNAAYKELGKIDKDVMKITGGGSGIDVGLIAGPDKGQDTLDG